MLKWLKQHFADPSAGNPLVRPRTFSYSQDIPVGLGIRPELAGDASGLVRKLEDALQGPFLLQFESA